jgi:hypothetical protein
MNPYPEHPPQAPEPGYVVWLRLIGGLALIVGIICTGLMFTIAPGARLFAIGGLALFAATALTAAVVGIVQEERHKGRHS